MDIVKTTEFMVSVIQQQKTNTNTQTSESYIFSVNCVLHHYKIAFDFLFNIFTLSFVVLYITSVVTPAFLLFAFI